MFNNTPFQSLSPDNFSNPICDRKNDPHIYAATFSCSIIIAVLSPVAVAGNALILGAIQKKSFQRTPLHILLSVLAATDLCTGLIAQPFTVATNLMSLTLACKNVSSRPLMFSTIDATGDGSATYFISITALMITLMGVERWLHMSRRSLVNSRRGCLIVFVLLLMPIPVVVFRSLETIKGNPALEFNITIIAVSLFCLVTTSVAYFNVLRTIRRHQRQVQANAPSQNFGPPAINLAKYKKSVVTILYILGLFYFCFLPFIVSIGAYVQVGKEDSRELSVALDVTTVILFLSSSLNPGLYLWRMNDVRVAVKKLFRSSS